MRAGVLAAAAAAVLALPAAAHADVTIQVVCTVGPASGACSTGWYTADVTVSFNLSGSGFTIVSGCTPTTVNSDTADYPLACTVDTGGGNITGKLVHIKRDATPPATTGITASRAADANGWYNHPVDVSVAGTDALSGIASCTTTAYGGPDSASATVTGTCRDNAGNVSAPQTLTFKYDATPPSINAAARGPDANGWYNRPVDVAFSGSDATSGIDSCSSGSYSGPDSASAGVSGTCRDAAGNVAARLFSLQYDATPPTVTGVTPDRPADANGWYNHQLVITFAGVDATSGIASCDGVSYTKPDTANATVDGRCRDNAGNVSNAGTFAFKYDSTPPKLDTLTGRALDRSAVVTWKTSGEVARVTVARATGSGTATTVYDGRTIGTFTDRGLRDGVRYRYTVSVHDDAGNSASRSVTASPSPPLIAPRQEAHVGGSVTLRWRSIAKATYYNVQVRLGSRKILSAWPTKPLCHVPNRLRPGRYVWAVWPGFGRQAAHSYGPLIGTSTFVVTGRR